ncbi:hypothetical protein FQN60_002686, partial [Etheostoma spectabile]
PFRSKGDPTSERWRREISLQWIYQYSLYYWKYRLYNFPCAHGENNCQEKKQAYMLLWRMGISWLGTRWMHTHTQPPTPFRRSLVSTVTEDKKKEAPAQLVFSNQEHRRSWKNSE